MPTGYVISFTLKERDRCLVSHGPLYSHHHPNVHIHTYIHTYLDTFSPLPQTQQQKSPEIPTPFFCLLHTRHLILDPRQQRHPLGIHIALAIGIRIKHLLPLTLADLCHSPRPLLSRLLEEVHVLIKRPAARLWQVEIRPQSRKRIRSRKHEEDEVIQIVKQHGGEKGNGKVCKPPDDD